MSTTLSAQPAQLRTLIFTARGRNAAKTVDTELKRLEAEYLRTHKRKLPSDMISISSWGDARDQRLGLTVYSDSSEMADLAFLQRTVTPSDLTA